MKIIVSWYDEDKTIIWQQFSKVWTWDDFFMAVNESVELEKSVNHPVYILVTQERETPTPPGNIIAQYEKAIKMHANNFRFLVTATENYIGSIFVGMWIKTTSLRGKVYMANTVQDALKLITEDKAKQKV